MLYLVLATRGWEVVGRAASGTDALRVADRVAPDLAVIDYMMPEMKGTELALQLKVRHPYCYVVMFSAFDVPASDLSTSQVDRYLNKLDVGVLPDLIDDLASEQLVQ